MPLRLVVAYGLILFMVCAALFGILRVRQKVAERRAINRGHRPKLLR